MEWKLLRNSSTFLNSYFNLNIIVTVFYLYSSKYLKHTLYYKSVQKMALVLIHTNNVAHTAQNQSRLENINLVYLPGQRLISKY